MTSECVCAHTYRRSGESIVWVISTCKGMAFCISYPTGTIVSLQCVWSFSLPFFAHQETYLTYWFKTENFPVDAPVFGVTLGRVMLAAEGVIGAGGEPIC